MTDLAGKTVLVTGASKGIGAAIVNAIGAAGAHVIAHYNTDRAGAEAATADVPRERKQLLQADFNDMTSVEALWRDAIGWRKQLDVFVNNAAVMLWNGGIDGEEKSWDAVWANTLQANVLAPARLMRQAVRHFRANGGGAIITISSWVAQRGVTNPDSMAYGASKAAVHSVTQGIARGYARDNVQAYIVCPGMVDAQMSRAFAETQPGGREAVESKLAMGKWVPPGEVADLVAFLATGRVKHLTGATLDVNGASNIR